jgi:DtxR family Mn-dependent transcriptional regulator
MAVDGSADDASDPDEAPGSGAEEDVEAGVDGVDAAALSPRYEDALRHIYRLETTGDGWVANADLARHLDVTRATVTSTFQALADRGLVEHETYRPVRLTDAGRRVALDVVRRHRLVETALCDLFDYGLSEVDVEADVLEHHLSDRLCAALERELGMPTTDPHGDPIPDAELTLPETVSTDSLASVPVATGRVEVRRVRSTDDAVIDYLADAGVAPGSVLTVAERTSFGMVTVDVDGSRTSLPSDVAGSVLVVPVDDAES